MIVEAGFDLAVLLFEGQSEPGALRIVALDRDLRLVALRTALTSFAGDLDAVALEAVNDAIPVWDGEELDRFAVRYVGLGYIVRDVSRYPEGFDWDEVKAVETWLSLRGIHLLGIQVSDGEQFASTGPVHAFDSYALEGDELPRILIIPGPHPFLRCECAACAPRREAWERARPIEPLDSV